MADALTLVTGAAGFVGGHLLDRLAGRQPLIGWARSREEGPAHPTPGVEWAMVDLIDRGAVDAAIAAHPPRRIYHLAGAANVGDSWHRSVDHLRVHALGTHYLLDAVRRHAPRARVVVVTSGLIYRSAGTPLSEDSPLGPANPYGLSKLAEDLLAQDAAREDGLDVIVARPFNHAGPRQSPSFVVSSFAQQMARIALGLAPPELQVGNIDARRDVTDVRDVVAAYERLMEAGVTGRVYNIASGVAHPVRDFIDRLAACAGAEIRLTVDPARLRPADQPVVIGDPSRIQRELGWAAAIPLDTTLRDTFEWWRHALAAAV